MDTIKFYRVGDDYGAFSNFSPYPIRVDGETWNTVEHYFQSAKFNDPEIKERIRLLTSPMEAALEGRKRSNPLREDWEEVKDEMMYRALWAKYTQHPALRELLLSTGEAHLIEHTKNDKYWADGGDGSGKNMLGILLMQVRKELCTVDNNPKLVLPPWVAYQDVDASDYFWREGLGELYIHLWTGYYEFLSDEEKLHYRNKFMEAEGWNGFYLE